jgi:hypothetical protein
MTRPSCKVIWIGVSVYFMVFFCNGHIVGLFSKTLWDLPSSSKNHIFYIVNIYIVLLDRVKLYKYIYFDTYTVLHNMQ